MVEFGEGFCQMIDGLLFEEESAAGRPPILYSAFVVGDYGAATGECFYGYDSKILHAGEEECFCMFVQLSHLMFILKAEYFDV